MAVTPSTPITPLAPLAPLALQGVVVEAALQFTLVELGWACRADVLQLVALVDEGVRLPGGDGPSAWRFAGAELPRARRALRLTHDLALSPPGVAPVLDLLDRISSLEARLLRLGQGRRPG